MFILFCTFTVYPTTPVCRGRFASYAQGTIILDSSYAFVSLFSSASFTSQSPMSRIANKQIQRKMEKGLLNIAALPCKYSSRPTYSKNLTSALINHLEEFPALNPRNWKSFFAKHLYDASPSISPISSVPGSTTFSSHRNEIRITFSALLI